MTRNPKHIKNFYHWNYLFICNEIQKVLFSTVVRSSNSWNENLFIRAIQFIRSVEYWNIGKKSYEESWKQSLCHMFFAISLKSLLRLLIIEGVMQEKMLFLNEVKILPQKYLAYYVSRRIADFWDALYCSNWYTCSQQQLQSIMDTLKWHEPEQICPVVYLGKILTGRCGS